MILEPWTRDKGDYHGHLPFTIRARGMVDLLLLIRGRRILLREHPLLSPNLSSIGEMLHSTLHQLQSHNHHPSNHPLDLGISYSRKHPFREKVPTHPLSMPRINRSHLDRDELVMSQSTILDEKNLVGDTVRWVHLSVRGRMITMLNHGWLWIHPLKSVIWV